MNEFKDILLKKKKKKENKNLKSQPKKKKKKKKKTQEMKGVVKKITLKLTGPKYADL